MLADAAISALGSTKDAGLDSSPSSLNASLFLVLASTWQALRQLFSTQTHFC